MHHPRRTERGAVAVEAAIITPLGKWQTVSVPIPTNYTCSSSVPTGCWVRLQYAYGGGNQPSDTTSWTAGIEGDPVRLVE
jgi:hypothetical protein